MKRAIIALLAVIGVASIAEVILDYLAYRSDEQNKPTEHEAMCPYFVEPQEVCDSYKCCKSRDSVNSRVTDEDISIVNDNSNEDK